MSAGRRWRQPRARFRRLLARRTASSLVPPSRWLRERRQRESGTDNATNREYRRRFHHVNDGAGTTIGGEYGSRPVRHALAEPAGTTVRRATSLGRLPSPAGRDIVQ